MAVRVPHYVRKRLDQIQSSMDARKFLMSDAFRRFLEGTVQASSGDYGLKVRFGGMVMTDGRTIWVDPLSRFVEHVKSVPQKTLLILGQLAHEFFHVLHTDFLSLRQLEIEFKKDKFRHKVAHECLNIVEDAAIERIGTKEYEGTFRVGIRLLNQTAYKVLPSLNELAAQGASPLKQFMQACMGYIIIGKLKGNLEDPLLLDLFSQAMPVLDKGRMGKTTWDRLEAARKLMAIAEPLIQMAEQNSQSDEDMNYPKNKQISSGGGAGQESDEENEGQGEEQEAPNQDEQQAEARREATRREIERLLQEMKRKKEEGEADYDQFGRGPQVEMEAGENPDSSSSSEQGDGEGDSSQKGQDKPKSRQQPTPRKSQKLKGQSGQQEDSASANHTGAADDPSSGDSEMVEALQALETSLKKAKENAARDAYDEAEEGKREQDLQKFARRMEGSAASLHKGIRVEAIRKFTLPAGIESRYENAMTAARPLVRSLVASMKDVIRRNEDLRVQNLYSGKVNTGKLYRIDQRVFYQDKEKADEADLAIVLLVDQSGSMSGDRIENARLAAMVLYEVCEAMKIPYAVIGHVAEFSSPHVQHRHFVDFESRDKMDRYKLLGMDAIANTREGLSLAYAGEFLKARRETDKVIIAISDGEPTHSCGSRSYYGEAAQKDSAAVVRSLVGQGIQVYGVAIGDGQSAIEQIYGGGFIDIPDLTTLPRKLTSLISRSLLK